MTDGGQTQRKAKQGAPRQAPKEPKESPASVGLREIADAFLESHKGQGSTRLTLAIHFRHLCRVLSGRAQSSEQGANAYAKERLAEGVRPYTVRKELGTLHRALRWAKRAELLNSAPAWNVADIPIGHDEGREPFRTFDQIQAIIARQGLKGKEAGRLWECLYLSSEDVDECLQHAERHGTAPFVYPMLAMVALTGCRRSEMLRSRPDDWDFTQGVVHIREQKRDTSRKYTTRAVDIHPTLAVIMKAWIHANPGSTNVITRPGETGELSVHTAHNSLKATLAKHPRWRHIPGFHTFRHSFASILACRGVDPRIIDRYMGHQTEDMRHRYMHLFPNATKEAIGKLLDNGG